MLSSMTAASSSSATSLNLQVNVNLEVNFVKRAADQWRGRADGDADARSAAPARVRDDRDMSSEEFTNAHPALAQFWHPVALSAELGPEPVAARLGGQGWALARINGGIVAFADACPHRRARLSAGQITGGTLQCPYHGWQFAPD